MDELINRCAGAKFFTSLDFTQAYHQIPLAPEDREKTAFFANGELYQYIFTPYGLKNAVSYCGKTMSEAFGDLPGVILYMDDLLVIGETQDEHDLNLRPVLERASQLGLSFNLEKCHFGQTSICYLGHLISNGTVRPDPSRLQPILDMPLPRTLKQLSSFIGMLSYLRGNIPNFAELAQPLYDMARFGKVEWTEDARYAVQSLKFQLAESVCHIPKPSDKLIVESDASDLTIAAYLRTDSGQPVAFASRKLRGAELNYDIIEKEALAIFWSVTEKFRTYLLGRPFTVYSDHQSLQWLLTTSNPTRKLLRWRMELQEFQFSVAYKPGNTNVIADCMSRAFLLISDQNDSDIERYELEQRERLQQLQAITAEEVKRHQRNDNQLPYFVSALRNRASSKPAQVSDELWALRKTVSYENGIVVHKEGNYTRFLIPPTLRAKTLALAHSGHPGRDAMIANMRQKVFWPRMRKEAVSYCEKCRTCAFCKPRFVPAPKLPIIVNSPMEMVSMDYIGPLPTGRGGMRYMLVIIDNFSRFPEVYPVRDLNTSTLLKHFRDWISRYGYPDSVLSDRGSQFESKLFRNYCAQFGIAKKRTTAYHPQGNGLCERFNGTIWRKIQVLTRVHNCPINRWPELLPIALFDYRNSVHGATGYTPFELVFQYAVRSQLPVQRRQNSKFRKAKENVKQHRIQRAKYYDRKSRFRRFYNGQACVLRNEHPTKANKFGTPVRVMRQIDSRVVLVRFENGDYDTVGVNRLSPLPDEYYYEENPNVSTPAEAEVLQEEAGEPELVVPDPVVEEDPPAPVVERRSSRIAAQEKPVYKTAPDLPRLTATDRVRNQKQFKQPDGTWAEVPVANDLNLCFEEDYF